MMRGRTLVERGECTGFFRRNEAARMGLILHYMLVSYHEHSATLS